MHVHIGSHDPGTKRVQQLAAYGITGVRDMASPVDDILQLRREVAEGSLNGPTIVVAGPILQRPLPFALPPLVRIVTEADAQRTVDDLRAKSVDFIKVGDTLTRNAYLAALVRAGMTPAQALDAATRAPAEFLGRLATEGTIEPGKRANLVLLDGNPLVDIVNTRKVAVVILRGRVLRFGG